MPHTKTALATPPTLWGLTPAQIHDRFWASRGVQVVRRGEAIDMIESAELYLLTDPDSLISFNLREVVDLLSWLQPRLMFLRLQDRTDRGYREVVEADEHAHLERIQRIYEDPDSRMARVALTPDVALASAWQSASSSNEGWRTLRKQVPSDERAVRSIRGRVFDATREKQTVEHMEYLMDRWSTPEATIRRAVPINDSTWADRDASIGSNVSSVGRVWIGAGRTLEENAVVVGPAVLWDSPDARPREDDVPWEELEPIALSGGLVIRPKARRHLSVFKRMFDILFATFALALTLPLYPIIALAIMIEDGWPLFFAHERETVGGKTFPCLKFRSMRRDAEEIKRRLQAENTSDGPQFFMENDPRSTRVGRFLRATTLDELPQFWNVLVGHMSVVGPRPSPRKENQFCPSWREARLSVRPGLTGLWQVERTRAEGLDFQEWIRYDLEYVERMSFRLDLSIIFRTCVVVARRLVNR